MNHITILYTYIKQFPTYRKRVAYIRCSCGVEKEVLLENINAGNIKSCGHAKSKYAGMIPQYDRGTYQCWLRIQQRCYCITNAAYRHYGGRGIIVCGRWLGKNGFINFIRDMGIKPKGLSIERINNDGDYEPRNCKWATLIEQNNNRRTVNKHQGKSIAQWARKLRISRPNLSAKVKRYGYAEAIKRQRLINSKRKSPAVVTGV